MRSSQTSLPVVSIFEPITRDNIADRIPEAARALGLPEQTVQELVAHPDLSQNFFNEGLCNAGNDALKLDSFKRNIAANLQFFALFVFDNHPEICIKAKNEFNTLFASIAHITDEKNVELAQGFQEHCTKLSLDDLQTLLTKVYFSELIRRISNKRELDHLLWLNFTSKKEIQLDDDVVRVIQEKALFTNTIIELAERKDKAIAEAARIGRELTELKVAPRKQSAPPALLSPVADNSKDNANQRRNSSESPSRAPKRKQSDPSDVFMKPDDAPSAENAAAPAKKRRFWHSEKFRRYMTGLALFAGVCLLGAGIAFSGGALGIGLIFAGLAFAAVGALMTAYNNKTTIIPTAFSPAAASYMTFYIYMPPSQQSRLNKQSRKEKAVEVADQPDLENQLNHSNINQAQPDAVPATGQRFERK